MNTRHLLRAALFAGACLVAVPAAGIASDSCGSPTVVSALPYTDVRDTTSATSEDADPVHSCTGARDTHSVWYRFTAATTGLVTASTGGSSYDTVLSVHTGGCADLNEVTCSEEAAEGGEVATFSVTAGTVYLVEVTAFLSAAGGTLHLTLHDVQTATNDDCSDATPISTTSFGDGFEISSASTAPGDPDQSCGFDPGSQNEKSVWFRFTAPSAGSLTVSTLGSDYDTVLTVYTGGCGALTEVACSDDANVEAEQFHSEIALAVNQGTTYMIEVTRFESDGAVLVLSVDLSGTGGPARGIQLTPDDKRVLVNKDVGSERWAISLNDDDTVTGNVFRADGGPPAFIFCEPRDAENDFACSGADPCTSGGAQRGIQGTPDGKRVLVNKDVGAERWAISLNDDGTATGNVFRSGGGAPAFIFCEPLAAPHSFRCSGADACVTEQCTDQYVIIGDVTLPSDFFTLPVPCGATYTFIGNVTLPPSFFSPQ